MIPFVNNSVGQDRQDTRGCFETAQNALNSLMPSGSAKAAECQPGFRATRGCLSPAGARNE